ncbi:hypothetical protein WJX81_007696 [Elliptochloris bilobata]|uniref:Prolyl endopeptidase n=1 Tax=Elliptochloris bilobata TaxID=381761 RepID=A0AAW1SEC6_9CHLO
MKNNHSAMASAAAGLLAGLILQPLARKGLREGKLRSALKGNVGLLSKRERHVVAELLHEHAYLFRNWPPPGVRDEQKRALVTRAAAHHDGVGEAVESERLAILQLPKALKRPKTLVAPNGDRREDPYYWLRDDDRQDPEVIAHLKAETAFTQACLADTAELQEQLYRDMRGAIQEADQTAPLREGNYYYYSKTLEGEQYRVSCRRRMPPGAGPPTEEDTMDEAVPEEVLLDGNVEARAYEFYNSAAVEVSPNETLLAWGEDRKGNEAYFVRVRDIATGKDLLKRPIEGTSGDLAWASDNKTLFYITKDKLDRPHKVWRHRICTDPEADELVYHEEDEAFYISLTHSRSKKLIFLDISSSITSNAMFLDADAPEAPPRPVFPRRSDHESTTSHRGDHLISVVRDPKKPNSEVVVSPMGDPGSTTVIIPHRDDVKIQAVSVSLNYLTVHERVEGLQVATVYKLPEGGAAPSGQLSGGQRVPVAEEAYALGPGPQGDFESDVLRLQFSSLATPPTTIDYNMATGKQRIRKVMPVLGGFDQNNYRTERLWATAKDGVRVPVSLVYRKDRLKRDGSNPVLLDGYGSYESCIEPAFALDHLPLVDRGFVYAIAHVRGGGELGRLWHEDGKFLKKRNTFTDFIAAAEHLVALEYTRPELLCAEGRSAGGLTMGAVTNMRPDLFCAVIMGVPFVDVVTTMLDPSIPLTVIEWEQWGNPNEPEYYEYMKSYSPIDNIRRTAYPNILLTGGLHDPRVAYWEPAKFVAKLRDYKTDDNMQLFKCDFGAGHFSKSGRFEILRETALEWAFLLK